MKLPGHLRRYIELLPDSWFTAQPQDAFERYDHLEVGMDADVAFRDPRQEVGPKFQLADQIGAPTAVFARDHGIASTPDRFAIPATQDDTQVFRTAFVVCAVFAALGLG
jgi:hypothetical protein